MGNASSDSGGGNDSSSSCGGGISSEAIDRCVNTITLDNGGSINCRTGETSSYSLNDAIGHTPSNSGLDRNDEDRPTYSSASSYDRQFVKDCYRSEREAYDKHLHIIDLENGYSYNMRTKDFAKDFDNPSFIDNNIKCSKVNDIKIINCKDYYYHDINAILNIVRTPEQLVIFRYSNIYVSCNSYYDFKTGVFSIINTDINGWTPIVGKLTHFDDIYDSKVKIDIPTTSRSRSFFRYKIDENYPKFITDIRKNFNYLAYYVSGRCDYLKCPTTYRPLTIYQAEAILLDAYDRCEKTQIKYFEDLMPRPSPIKNRPPVASAPQPNSISTRVENGHVMSAQARVNAVNQVASVVSTTARAVANVATAVGNAYIQGSNDMANTRRMEAQATQQLVSNVANAVVNNAPQVIRETAQGVSSVGFEVATQVASGLHTTNLMISGANEALSSINNREKGVVETTGEAVATGVATYVGGQVGSVISTGLLVKTAIETNVNVVGNIIKEEINKYQQGGV